MVYMIRENVISQQVEHWIARVIVRVMDNRKMGSIETYAEGKKATEEFTLFFELDGEGYDTEDKSYEMKRKATQILSELGYTGCGIIDTYIQPYEYDAERAYKEIIR